MTSWPAVHADAKPSHTHISLSYYNSNSLPPQKADPPFHVKIKEPLPYDGEPLDQCCSQGFPLKVLMLLQYGSGAINTLKGQISGKKASTFRD